MATTIIQVRRDTAANWTSNNPILATGELGFETDTGLFKIGRNDIAWTSLAYAQVAGPTGPVGETGATGAPGDNGMPGDNGEPGDNGLSAYEVWINLGNSGSEQDFIDSLQGPEGIAGMAGAAGEAGPAGADGTFATAQEVTYIVQTMGGVYNQDITPANAGKVFRVLNTNGDVAFTISSDSNPYDIPVGTRFDFLQRGSSPVYFIASSGVDLFAKGLVLNGEGAGATLVKTAANEWFLVGDLTSA